MNFYQKKKSDSEKIGDFCAQIYGEENILRKIEVNLQTYDVMVRKPLILIDYYDASHLYNLSSLKPRISYEEQQIIDTKKREYCAQHNIPYIIFYSYEKNFLNLEFIKDKFGIKSWFGTRLLF